jgi:signal transduction histidine kinase
MILTKAVGDLISFHKEMNKTLGKTQVLEEKMIRREKQFKQLSSNAGINGFAAFSGAIAHELAQPLAAMLLNIDRMIRHLTKTDAESALLTDLHRIKLDNERAINIIKSIRLLLRDDAPLLEAPLQIDQLVRDAVYVSKKDIITNNILFTQNDYLGSVQIPGHDGLLLQVITNLINNAINATSGVVAPHINLSTIGNHDYVFLALSDNGCGINSSDSEAVFMPFKSISEHGRGLGLGLGLSIIQSIVKKHNGDIGYIKNVEAGVTFIVGLPRTVDTPAYVFNQTMARELIDKHITLLQTSLLYNESFTHQTISS